MNTDDRWQLWARWLAEKKKLQQARDQVLAWERQVEMSQERCIRLCADRGHGRIDSFREPHERMQHRCTFCGEYL